MVLHSQETSWDEVSHSNTPMHYASSERKEICQIKCIFEADVLQYEPDPPHQ